MKILMVLELQRNSGSADMFWLCEMSTFNKTKPVTPCASTLSFFAPRYDLSHKHFARTLGMCITANITECWDNSSIKWITFSILTDLVKVYNGDPVNSSANMQVFFQGPTRLAILASFVTASCFFLYCFWWLLCGSSKLTFFFTSNELSNPWLA